MMTAAVLSSAFRNSRITTASNPSLPPDHVEQFLKEVGLILFQEGSSMSAAPLNKAGNLAEDCKTSMDTDIYSDASSADPGEAATFIQAQVRRYLQQKHFQLQQLEQRLVAIRLGQDRELAQIERRRDRKMRRVRRRHDREEREKDEEVQRVVGIVTYLKRNQALCTKELENHRALCRELKLENQQLQLAQKRTLQATHTKKQHFRELQATNSQLQTRLLVQEEAIRQCQLHLHEQPCHSHSQVLPMAVQVVPRQDAAKSYETRINVNCVNEMEERCFHYRLVQDVYTLTPSRSGYRFNAAAT